jgi:hypothetical protein
MNKETFQVGDKVYHISQPSIHWVIEKIDNKEAFCSTIIKETLEQKKESFSLTSIKKYVHIPATFGISTVKGRNHYF